MNRALLYPPSTFSRMRSNLEFEQVDEMESEDEYFDVADSISDRDDGPEI